MPTENRIDCPALHKRSKSYPFGDRVPRTVRMFTTVVADPIPGTAWSLVKGDAPICPEGQIFPAWTNSHGAVAAVLPDGKHLGLRPAEFEVDTWHDLAPAPAASGDCRMNTRWKLVPIEPTREMLVAALKTNGACPIYAAMLGAAPAPPKADAGPVAWMIAKRYYSDHPIPNDAGYEVVEFHQNPKCPELEKYTPLYTHPDAGDFAPVTAERDALQLRLNAADQRIYELESGAGDDFPPCDYCGTVPDYHPWHGAGLINGQESPHIHACTECRHKLPTAPAPVSMALPDRLGSPESIKAVLDSVGRAGRVSYLDARDIWNACLDAVAKLNPPQ